MKNHGTVRLAMPHQVKEVMATLAQGMPNMLEFYDAAAINARKGKFIVDIMRVFKNYRIHDVIQPQIEEWEKLYLKFFKSRRNVCVWPVPLSNFEDGFRCLMAEDSTLSLQQVLDVCRDVFKSVDYSKLDTIDIEKIRDVEKGWSMRDHIYWIQGGDAGDRDLKNVSALELVRGKVRCMTLKGRLLLELKHFLKTGKHLEGGGYSTLCAWSIYHYPGKQDAAVPTVEMGRGSFTVGLVNIRDSWDPMRARRIIM